MQKPLSFCWLGLLLIAGCATAPAPVEIQGLEAFQQPCPNSPPVLSDAEIAALFAQYPTADERERLFWTPRDLRHRAHSLCESARANGAVSLGARFNQAVRETR